MSSPILSIVLLVLFLFLNVLDAHSTWLVISPNHFYREKNIFARFFFKKLGPLSGIITFKVLLLSILGLLIWFYVLPEYLSLNISMLIGNAIFIAVVWNNYRIYRRISR